MGRIPVIVPLQGNILTSPVYSDLHMDAQDRYWCSTLKARESLVLRNSNNFVCVKLIKLFKSQVTLTGKGCGESYIVKT